MKQPTKSPPTTQKNVAPQSTRVARLALGMYLLFFLIGQLFTFEKFPSLLESVGFGAILATFTAILLVVLELVALPFLIGLEVSKKVLRMSLISCFGALVTLSIVEVVASGSDASVIFGATFELPGGSWSLLLVAALWVLFIWSSRALQRWDSPRGLKGRKQKSRAFN